MTGSVWPPRPRFGAVTEAGCGVGAAVVVTVAVLFGAQLWRGAPYSVGYSLHAATNVAVIGCLTAIIATIWCGRRGVRWRVPAAYLLTAALPTLAFGIPLARTPLWYGGLALDQQFRTQYLTRLADSPLLADMNYAGLAPYYPAGWFWPPAQLARIAGVAPWLLMKPWALLTFSVAAVLALALWRQIAGQLTGRGSTTGFGREGIALAATTGTVLAVVFTSHQEPYSGALAILAPPMAVIAWSAVRTGRRTALVLAGIGLGIALSVYTLYGAVAGLALVVLTVSAAAADRVPARVAIARCAAIVGGGAVIGLLVWLPYLLAWAGNPGAAHGTAQEYLPTAGAAAWLAQFEVTPLGVVAAIGTVWVLWRCGRNRIARALAALLAASYLWILASLAASLVGSTLLGFRVIPLTYTATAAAAVFAAAELWGWLRARFADPDSVRALTRTALAVCLGVAVAVAQQGTWHLLRDGGTAYTDVGCSGTRADGAPAGPRAALPQVHTAITELTGRAATDTVVLPTDFALLACFPYRGYTSYIAQYANPLADELARKQAVIEMSQARDPARLRAVLNAVPGDPPEVFVFQTDPAGLRLDVTRDVFPADPNTAWERLIFSPAAFDGPQYRTRVVGDYVVIALE